LLCKDINSEVDDMKKSVSKPLQQFTMLPSSIFVICTGLIIMLMQEGGDLATPCLNGRKFFLGYKFND